MQLKDLFETLGGGDARLYGVIMPLTSSLSIESPNDVVGFAWRTVTDDSVRVVTFPDRNWEPTAQYTGMNKALYEASLAESMGDRPDLTDLLSFPVVAYASNILRKALSVMDSQSTVIEIPRALARLKSKALAPSDCTTQWKLASWLNTGVPLRKMSRKDAVNAYGILVDDRSGLPVIGRNLAIDAALFDKALAMDVEIAEKDADELPL